MFKKLLKVLITIIISIIIIITSINLIIITTTKERILSINEIKEIKDIECILILGAGIRGNYPSPMLEDRLKQGKELYDQNLSSKIVASGDHMSEYYDEVNVMKDYLVGHQVPSQDIFMDHAGISTYDSIYRIQKIFKAKKVAIVTQEYHLYRSLYIAKKLDIEAYGVAADKRTYLNQTAREIREILARVKDFFKAQIKPQSTYLGKEISLTGNGDITNDK